MVADIRAARQRGNTQESDIKPGDAIFFITGCGSPWMKNNDRFNSGKPSIMLEVVRCVTDKDVSLTGADTWAVEAGRTPTRASPSRAIRAANQARHPS